LLVALAIVIGIAFVGLWFLGAVSSGRPMEKIEPEDVVELDVYFVCRECGTEFQVTRLGEVQVPRHCGEPMQVERRPRAPSGA
jgi:rubredoxin